MVGAVDADQLADLARGIPQILEFYNIAGDRTCLCTFGSTTPRISPVWSTRCGVAAR